MKQYIIRKSDKISSDKASITLASCRIMFIHENTKTYTHKMVDVNMNM